MTHTHLRFMIHPVYLYKNTHILCHSKYVAFGENGNIHPVACPFPIVQMATCRRRALVGSHATKGTALLVTSIFNMLAFDYNGTLFLTDSYMGYYDALYVYMYDIDTKTLVHKIPLPKEWINTKIVGDNGAVIIYNRALLGHYNNTTFIYADANGFRHVKVNHKVLHVAVNEDWVYIKNQQSIYKYKIKGSFNNSHLEPGEWSHHAYHACDFMQVSNGLLHLFRKTHKHTIITSFNITRDFMEVMRCTIPIEANFSVYGDAVLMWLKGHLTLTTIYANDTNCTRARQDVIHRMLQLPEIEQRVLEFV